MWKSSARTAYCWLKHCWWKSSLCRPRNHQRNTFLRLTVKSSVCIAYTWLKNHWRTLSRYQPRNHQRDIFLRLTLKSSAKSMSLLIQKSAAMIKSFIVLHLATPVNHYISHKYNHNPISCFIITHVRSSTNKIEALYGIIHVSATTCFQGSLITQFALNIIPTPFHIT
jgi:hypothetical protein